MLYLSYLKTVRFNIEFTTLFTYIAIYIVQIIFTNDFSPYVSFTGFAFYIAVRCSFDKHLYLTSCLKPHYHNTCIRLSQTGYAARKMALLIISQDRQTQLTSTCRYCHGNHHNYRLKLMISVIIVTGKVFHCFCL